MTTEAHSTRSGQALYRALVDSSLAGMYVWQNGEFLYVNQAMASIFGYSADELTHGFKAIEVVHPDDRPVVEANVRRRLEGDVDAVQYAFRGVRKDGSQLYCEVLGRTRDFDGQPVIIGTLIDVTERERAERERQTLSQAVEHSASVVVITDPAGIIEYVNPKFTEVTGYSAEQVVGEHVRLIRSGETPKSTYGELWDTILSGKEWKGMFRNKKRNGELYWALSTIGPIVNETGEIRQFIAVQEDVTDRVQAESTLRKQAADLALLNSVNGLVNSGEEFPAITKHLTDQIKLNFGCENASLYLVDSDGQRLDLVTLGAHPETISRLESTIRTKIPQVSIELRTAQLHRTTLRHGRPQLIRDPQVIRQLMAEHTSSAALRRAVPLVADLLKIESVINVPLALQGEPVGLLSVSSTRELGSPELERLGALAGPITVAIIRKRAEERSRQLTEELEHRVQARTAQLEVANRELEAFSYSVSHDLRAPLRSIDGFAQALLEDYTDRLDETGRDYLERVRNAAHRMAQLIDDLLDLSRVARAELSYQMVDLSELASSIAAELQAQAPERKVEWVVEPELTARGDPLLLRVVLENLLGNAWKFTSRRIAARVEFAAASVDGDQAFTVRDNGAGFDMRYAEKLFDTFHRLHSGSEFPGTGVGLASVQRVIHRHGGKVWAEGAVDEGASFYFTLPHHGDSQ